MSRADGGRGEGRPGAGGPPPERGLSDPAPTLGGMHLSTVILPDRRWAEGGRASWQRAEELGFHTAYTYDHLSWRTFRDGPWFGAVPTLTAAAGVTSRMRLGTLVTSPNFRHPVTLAKELISLDDISGGRITLGIGAAAPGSTRRPCWRAAGSRGRRGSGRITSASSCRCWTGC
ncbi:hypothetical protein GCM10020000_39670 [Streptomyces olivoverticillatus]